MTAKPMRLPDELIDTNDIEHMEVGSLGYTLPWAIWTDAEMNVWIHKRYSVSDKPAGTHEMLIQRTEGGVKVHRGHLRPQRPQHGHSFAGTGEDDFLPVVGWY